MIDGRVETVRALAEALFPVIHQDAEAARSAKQETLATFLETGAAQVDFVIAGVSSWLVSSAELTHEHISGVKPRLRDWGPGSLCRSVDVTLSPCMSQRT